MQSHVVSNLFLFSLFFCEITFGAGESLNDSSNRCRFLELIRMHSQNEFTCRVVQWKGIERLKLRVTIRNLSIPEDVVIADRIQQWIENRLKNSRNIVLQDIQSRNYFRIIAIRNIVKDFRVYIEELKIGVFSR